MAPDFGANTAKGEAAEGEGEEKFPGPGLMPKHIPKKIVFDDREKQSGWWVLLQVANRPAFRFPHTVSKLHQHECGIV